MHLIIIEGMDNIGKDTLQNKLIDLFSTVSIIHCSGPTAKVMFNQEQDYTFKQYARNIVNGAYDYTDCIIMNRSHIGEYVYGYMYRNRSKSKVLSMIQEIDDLLLSRKDLTVKYVQLECTDVKLLAQNDDKKSLSDANINKLKQEHELFLEIFKQSKLNKQLVYVDVSGKFRSEDAIFDDVKNFLNEE